MYQELARELAGWEHRKDELIAFLEELRARGYVVTPLQDKDAQGAKGLIQEIDPFTFFGVFNRRIGLDQRLGILAQVKSFFQLHSELPEDFNAFESVYFAVDVF